MPRPPASLKSLAGILLGAIALAASPATQPAFQSYLLDHSTPTDPALQSQLEAIDSTLRARYDMTDAHTAVGLLDLFAPAPRLAMLRPDREEYAASVPKIGILLAFFHEHPDAATNLDPAVRKELGQMIKQSSNEMAAKYSRQITLSRIQAILNAHGFYDPARGGGLWVGKHYGKDPERHGSPAGDNSHAATVRQLLRFYLLLEQDKLLSPAASRTMREIFASPDLPHDDLKFARALKDRDGLTLLRKWGSWKDWLHDTAIITAPGRHYILVALTRHPRGDPYLEDLARAVDDLMRQEPSSLSSHGRSNDTTKGAEK